MTVPASVILISCLLKLAESTIFKSDLTFSGRTTKLALQTVLLYRA